MKFYYRLIKSNKGSSIVLVLLVILILTTLGTIALSLGLGNMRMADKYRKSSEQYYSLERAAEEAMSYIDKKLEESQNLALEYMRNEKYTKDNQSSELKNGYNQKFFYSRWKSFVYDDTLESALDLQGNVKQVTNVNRYNEKLELFFKPAFEILYFNYTLKKLDNIQQDVKNNVEALKEQGMDCKVELTKNKAYDTVAEGSIWDNFEYENNDVTIKIEVSDASGRKLTAFLNIKPPTCTSVENDTNIAVQGNPIWANAITAFGNVEFKDVTANISGDIFAADKSGSGKGINIKNSNVNINGNVFSKGDFQVATGNSKVNISKYTSDVKVDYKSGMYDKDAWGNKNQVFFMKYDNTVLSSYNHINRWVEGEAIRDVPLENIPKIPTLAKDYNGGNVYCDNLALEKSTENAEISIDGYVWTKHNLINNSQGGSSIIVNGNYIGIGPPAIEKNIDVDPKGYRKAEFVDDFGGSCVINNIYDKSKMNDIQLKGKFIVPGNKVLTDVNNKEYQTFESISANVWTSDEFLKPYISADGSGENYTFIINNVQQTYNLITDYNKKLENYIAYTKNNEDNSTPRNLLSGISNVEVNEAEGYVTGAAIVKKDGSHKLYSSYTNKHSDAHLLKGLKISENSTVNSYDAWMRTDQCVRDGMFEKIFKSKTEYLGLFNIQLSGLVNKSVLLKQDGTVVPENESGILYLTEANNTFTVQGSKNGIIYAEGNLNLTGSGVFKGAIICTGNVTVSGNVNLHYDEGRIAEILKNHDIAKNFFRPGAIGDAIFYDNYKATNARVKAITDKKRYNLLQWKKN